MGVQRFKLGHISQIDQRSELSRSLAAQTRYFAAARDQHGSVRRGEPAGVVKRAWTKPRIGNIEPIPHGQIRCCTRDILSAFYMFKQGGVKREFGGDDGYIPSD